MAGRSDPPFFILGVSRSGTTLLSAILASHSRIAVYTESHYYPFFRPHLHRYGDLGRPGNLRRFVSDVREVMRLKPKFNAPTTEEFLDALTAPSFVGRFNQMPRRDIEWIESGCAEGMEALDYQLALGKPRARRIAPPGRLNLILERLRFYGVKRNRWRRAWMRWKIVLRVRATDLLSSTRGRFR